MSEGKNEPYAIISICGTYETWLPGLPEGEKRDQYFGGYLLADENGGFGGKITDYHGESVLTGSFDTGNILMFNINYVHASKYARKGPIYMELTNIDTNVWAGFWESEDDVGEITLFLSEPIRLPI